MTATVLRFPQPSPPEPFEAEYLALMATDGVPEVYGVVIDLAAWRAPVQPSAGQDNGMVALEQTQTA